MKKTLICLLSGLLTLCLFVGCSCEWGGGQHLYKSIKVTQDPNRTVFVYFTEEDFTQQFDFTGLEVRGFRNKKDPKGVDITKECYVYSPKLSSGTLVTENLKGTHELTVFYTQDGGTLTTTFEVKVINGKDFKMKIGLDNVIIPGGVQTYLKWFKGFEEAWDETAGNSSISEIELVQQNPQSFEEGKSFTKTCDLTNDDNGKIKGYRESVPDTGEFKIYIVGEFFVGNQDSRGMFSHFKKLTKIKNINLFDTIMVDNMISMFKDCTNLTSLDLSGWDTSKVISMESMFEDCTNLTSLDLSGWDTSKVESMESMFEGCTSLTSIDLSSFDISDNEARSSVVTDYMFKDCGPVGEPLTVTIPSDKSVKSEWDTLLGGFGFTQVGTTTTYTRTR